MHALEVVALDHQVEHALAARLVAELQEARAQLVKIEEAGGSVELIQ